MLTSDIMVHVAASKSLTADDAKAMRQIVYCDGKIDPHELDMLFVLDDAAERRDPEWSAFFCETVTDFIVNHQEPRGLVSEDKLRWLAERIGRGGELSENGKTVLGLIAAQSPEMHPSLTPLIDDAA